MVKIWCDECGEEIHSGAVYYRDINGRDVVCNRCIDDVISELMEEHEQVNEADADVYGLHD